MYCNVISFSNNVFMYFLLYCIDWTYKKNKKKLWRKTAFLIKTIFPGCLAELERK